MRDQRLKALFFILLIGSTHAFRLGNEVQVRAKLEAGANSTADSVVKNRGRPVRLGSAYRCGGNFQRRTYNGRRARRVTTPTKGGGRTLTNRQYTNNGYTVSETYSAEGVTTGQLGRTESFVVNDAVVTVETTAEEIATTTVWSSTKVIRNSNGDYVTRQLTKSFTESCVPELVPTKPLVDEGVLVGTELVPEVSAVGLAPVWPILLASAVVLMGGLYLYHRHRMNSGVVNSFCPVTSWTGDPVGLLIGSSASNAFAGQIEPFLGEDNHHGMPKCHGLRKHSIPSSNSCDGDVDCKRQACRQMCCDRQDCTFFQFNSGEKDDHCWLGSRERLSGPTCENPWFGETCTTCRDRRTELWPQLHNDNSKCHSAFLHYTGFVVANQYECQEHAAEQGHRFYQYDANRKRCESVETCDNPSTNTVHSWKIFTNSEAQQQPEHVQVPADQEEWVFEPMMFHENSDMQQVRLSGAERCSDANDAGCMRDACRAKCLEHDWCIHYQFQSGSHACHLGAAATPDERNVAMWFGGILSNNRLCSANEHKCPSSHDCVSACGECAGYSREGPDGWCVRSAVENMVDAENWMDEYQQTPIDAWCRGLEKAVVTVNDPMQAGHGGGDICRSACASDPQCAMWQMHAADATKTDYAIGDQVKCWLGLEDNAGNSRFSCTGRSPRRWRLLSSPQGEAIRERGCTDGRVACVITDTCVDICQDECPGFVKTDREAGMCQPPENPEMLQTGAPMDHAIASSLGDLHMNPEHALIADELDLLTMQVNVDRLITPDFEGDSTTVCDTMDGDCQFLDGACVCDFDETSSCDDLFGQTGRVVPVLAEDGMLLLAHDQCACEGNHCSMNLLSSVPPLKIDEEAAVAISLQGDEMQQCNEGIVCPNMDTCTPLQYGAHGCGYDCLRDGEAYWCSNRCRCNQKEERHECAANVVCPGKDHCEPISYGDYGCGYGCTKDGTFYFCSDNCEECNV